MTPGRAVATLIGKTAWGLVAEAGRREPGEASGSVVAAVSGAVYLSVRPGAGAEGQIVWVAPETAPAHGRCILGPTDLADHLGRVRAGTAVRVRGSVLDVGGQLELDASRATVWEGSRVGQGDAAPLAVVAGRFRRVLDTAGRRLGAAVGSAACRGGTLPLVLRLLSTLYLGRGDGGYGAVTSDRGRDGRPAADNQFASMFAGPAAHLAVACLGGDMRSVASEGKELVGLGAGLTPSGDDFLGGLLYVAQHLRAAFPEEFTWEDRLVADLVEWSRPRTNRVSHAFLSDLAAGSGPAPLHDLVTSLLRAEEAGYPGTGGVDAAVERLDGIGHTSGLDLLAGSITGGLLAAGRSTPARPRP